MRLVTTLALALLLGPSVVAQDLPVHENQTAPPWGPGAWLGAERPLQPSDLRGRVAYVAVLPRTDERARADLAATVARYRGASDVAVVAIAASGASRLAAQLGVPVCDGLPRDLARVYGAPRAAWSLAIDRRGIVRYHGAALSAGRAALVLDALRSAGRQVNPLIGKPFPSINGLRFHGAAGHDVKAHRLTLVRWWTASCPHCAASVPDLAALHRRHRAAGLAFLPVYHYKGGRRLSPRELQAYLARLGHRGPFAEDPGWATLRDVMGRAGFTGATSVSFLVDARGIVRWVHPGPRVHASESHRHAGPDADLRGLAATVDALLVEQTQRDVPPSGRTTGRRTGQSR